MYVVILDVAKSGRCVPHHPELEVGLPRDWKLFTCRELELYNI